MCEPITPLNRVRLFGACETDATSTLLSKAAHAATLPLEGWLADGFEKRGEIQARVAHMRPGSARCYAHYGIRTFGGKAGQIPSLTAMWAIVIAVVAAAAAQAGGGPENVLLLVNANSESSKTIANHYIQWRQIPASNVVYIDWKRSLWNCSAAHFREEILQPALDAIEERKLGMQIDYLVYSSDFPWRVGFKDDHEDRQLPRSFRPDASLTGATYLWQFMQLKHIGIISPASNWYVPKSPQNNQAVCVELGNIASRAFRFHYLWTSSGGRTTSQANGQRYLLSMMLGVTTGRGNSVDEVLSYLRRSIAADHTRPSGTFYFMKGNGARSIPRHDCYIEAAQKLRQQGFGAEVLNGDLPKNRSDVLGIMTGVSHFDLDSANCRLLPGAVCDHLTSLGGDLRSEAAQSPLTEFLRHGAAGACGTVVEPFAIQAKFPLPSLPLHYMRGCSLAEAFYQSISGPYQLLLVGDPLCQPWAVPLGLNVEGIDADQVVNGTVTLTPSVTASPGRRARFFELYVDGALKSRVPPDRPLPLDTTDLADGYHELRVVAVDSQPTECQSRVIAPFYVSNRSKHLDLEVVPEGEVGVEGTLTLSAGQAGAERIVFLHNERVLQAVPGERAEVTIEASMLGRGPVRLQARSEGVSPAVSKPISVNVR